MKAILLAATIFIAMNAHARATTIVVFFDPTKIVVGADSKLTGIYVPDKLVCKISIVRNVVWTASGDLTFSETYSVADVVNAEVNKNLSIQQTMGNITDMLHYILSSILSNAKGWGIPRFVKGDRVDYEAIGAHVGIQIVFGYVDSGTVNIDFIQINLPPHPGPNDTLQIVRKHCPSVSCGPVGYFLLGEYEIIGPELSADLGIVSRLGIQQTIDHFVEEEAAVHDSVSAPVAILRLSGSDAEWIEKGKCDKPPY